MDITMSGGNELRQGCVMILSTIANVNRDFADSILTSCGDDVQRAIDVLLGMEDNPDIMKVPPPASFPTSSPADLEDIREEAAVQNTLSLDSPVADDDDDSIYVESAPDDGLQEAMEGVENHVGRDGNDVSSPHDDEVNTSTSGLVVHALYFVPQVREAVSKLRRVGQPLALVTSHLDHLVYELANFFALAHQPGFDRDSLFRQLASVIPDCGQSLDAVARLSKACYDSIVGYIEQYRRTQQTGADDFSNTFSFSLGNVTFQKDESRARLQPLGECRLARLELRRCKSSRDLMSVITENMTETDGLVSSHNLIIDPSTIIPFCVNAGGDRTIAAGGGSMSPFTYPRTIFLDRFLSRNFPLVDDRRVIKNDLLRQVQRLKADRVLLTESEGQDGLKTLETAIYYYDHVADHRNDPERTARLKATSDHLKEIVARIRILVDGDFRMSYNFSLPDQQVRVPGIDRQLSDLQAKLDTVYDCPELQAFQYDLRSVIVDTGVPGPNQLYLYAHDEAGRWWKTVSDDVDEVTEDTVLGDRAGCQGSGGYLLIYSRHIATEDMAYAFPKPYKRRSTKGGRLYDALERKGAVAGRQHPQTINPTHTAASNVTQTATDRVHTSGSCIPEKDQQNLYSPQNILPVPSAEGLLLARATEEIKKAQAMITLLRNDNEGFVNAMREKDLELAELRQWLNESNLEHLDELRDKEAEYNQMLANIDGKLEACRNEGSQVRQELTELSLKHSALEAQYDQSIQSIRNTRETLDKLQQEIEAYQHSEAQSKQNLRSLRDSATCEICYTNPRSHM
ncbi:hypothetical protein CVT26_000555 [Gymnopilus dilepis]|uniref:USP domain-containing protein n=1 Tax=Gymnopilus dilepis TaxID=231916 RepID=A0A409WL04_9AGAR|nr:hypothetical protein CVT26_000555 [Gymnopilus dilepis]